MKLESSKLVIRQLDAKMKPYHLLQEIQPATGWVHLIRKTLKSPGHHLGNIKLVIFNSSEDSSQKSPDDGKKFQLK